ncbi:MAG: C69 family dipeptidase [Oscillospiraceae bacterium]
MCDTVVALKNATAQKVVLFGKNSDRDPNEPHIMVYIPRKNHGAGEMVKTTYTAIPQVSTTHAVMLFKPAWLWGCEMGTNEYGLTIGNEAVFTRMKKEKPTLIGMDYIRLALERAKTAEEAKNIITTLLAQYGQGGNCAYRGTMKYDNAYILADREEAWILETAGRFWAAKKVRDVASISNCLSIGRDYDEIHQGAVAYAIKRRWCKSEEDFNFARCFTDPLFTYFSKGEKRRKLSLTALQKNKGDITWRTLKDILRSHSPDERGENPLAESSMDSVCMHGGGLISDHTTGSLIAQLGDRPRYWATGASTPCFSIFKPLWFSDKAPIFREDETASAIGYWTRREKLFRGALAGEIDTARYIEARDSLETFLDDIEGDEQVVMRDAFEAEGRFVATAKKEFSVDSPKPLGGAMYRRYWKKQRKLL